MIKRLKIAAIIISGLLGFTACKKTDSLQAVQNATSEISSAAVTYQNPFGILVSESNGHTMAAKDQAKLARDLGLAYARLAISNIQWFDERDRNRFLAAYKEYTNGSPSVKILLNVNWGHHQGGPIPYPGASTEYKAYIKSITDTLSSGRYVPPAVLVVDNEENNPNYHVLETDADLQKYVDQIAFVAAEAHKKGLKVTNAGFTVLTVTLLVWDYFQNRLGDAVRANKFLNNVMPEKMRNIIFVKQADKYMEKLHNAKYFANAYKLSQLDYVNMHWYEPTKLVFWKDKFPATGIVDSTKISPGVLQEVFAFFKDPQTLGGKKFISNEVGQLGPANELPRQLSCAFQGLPFVIWYSGDRGEVGTRLYQQWALHTTFPKGSVPAYSIRPNGFAYRNNVASIVANPFTFCAPIASTGE